MRQYIDGLPFKMRAEYDFSFMRRYGRVFKVFDDQDSGNICFGTEKDGQRYFVKYAGAPTAEYDGDPADAVRRLRATLPVYRELKYPGLIELAYAEDIAGGFAMIFKWADGDCMGRMYPEAHRRFMSLPVGDRLVVFRDVLGFLDYVSSNGWFAADFYDGSIMYDFESKRTTVCDIDFFRRKPCVNDMGRMWGSSAFMSPEEFQLGAVLDETTSVYTAGAFAFALFGRYQRIPESWELGGELFAVAAKAVSDDRSARQQTVREFAEEWEAALGCALV